MLYNWRTIRITNILFGSESGNILAKNIKRWMFKGVKE